MKKTDYSKMMEFLDENRRKMIEYRTGVKISATQWDELKCEAGMSFHPNVMMECLTKTADGVVCFDREKVIHNAKQKQQFYFLLKNKYIAVWKDIEHQTPYFEVVEDEIISGAYNTATGEKVSKRVLISNDPERAPYIYPAQEIARFKEKIHTATNAPQRAK